jgi:hypothetical protein
MRQSVAHGVYEDEQLTTIQKRICLIEFLFMVGLLFVKARRPDHPSPLCKTFGWQARKFKPHKNT